MLALVLCWFVIIVDDMHLLCSYYGLFVTLLFVCCVCFCDLICFDFWFVWLFACFVGFGLVWFVCFVLFCWVFVVFCFI